MMVASALETLPINKAKAIDASEKITSKMNRMALDSFII
jgi:hypothetical protein